MVEAVETTLLELKRQNPETVNAFHASKDVNLLDRYTDIEELVRVTAYCLHLIQKIEKQSRIIKKY